MVINPIVWRRSIREYSEEPVLDESVNDIIKAAQFAPSAMGKRAVDFIVIKDDSTKEKLARTTGQEPVKKAPILLFLIANTNLAVLADHDLAVASSFAMVQAAALGLGTVWIHIEEDRKNEIRAAMGIPANFDFINIIPIGYPKNELADHGDGDFDSQKIHFEKY